MNLIDRGDYPDIINKMIYYNNTADDELNATIKDKQLTDDAKISRDIQGHLQEVITYIIKAQLNTNASGKESRRHIRFMLLLFVLIQVSCGHVISPEDYEMKWNLPIKAERTNLAIFVNDMNITIGTYHNNEVEGTMLYKDRLKVEVNTTDDGKEQIKLRILNPTASDLIADYTADVYLNTGKLLAGIKPDFDVQLEPYTSYVIASEGNVAKLVWILQDNILPTRIIISRENKLYHIKQFVAEWTEGKCLNQQQCDVDLTSTPDVGGINQIITLSIQTITSTDFDFIFYCQVFTPGGMSMKSDIQLVHEGCTCPPGEFATSKCSTSKTMRCGKCQPNTFNMNRDESTSCQGCKSAYGSQSHVLHYCNSTSDMKCECNHGFQIRQGKLDTACFSVEGRRINRSNEGASEPENNRII